MAVNANDPDDADDPPATDAQDVYDELYRALARHHGGQHVDKLARHLVRVDHARDLVALVEDVSRAVVYTPDAHTLTAHAFDRHGFEAEPAAVLWERVSDPAAWLDAHLDRPDWIHPRYRWLLDLPEDHATWSYAIEPSGRRVHYMPQHRGP